MGSLVASMQNHNMLVSQIEFFIGACAMQPVFRTVKCPGIDCPRTLRYAVSETDYGTKKILCCPRCCAEISITIPLPTGQPDTKNEATWFTDVFNNIADLFGDNKKNNK
jgi:hypothetical protein